MERNIEYANPSRKGWVAKFKRTWQLHTFMIPSFVWVFVFCYIPMLGLIIAFQNYLPSKGFLESEWVGLKHFEKFFTNYQFKRVVGNTLKLSFTNLVVCFPLPIIFALLLNVIKNARIKKLIQTIACIPHFISVTVVVGMMFTMLNPVSGVYGAFYRLFGGEGYPSSITATADSFLPLYVLSDLWQHMGWNAIIYLAALSGVDPQLYEAASLDGASRWKQIWTIDLPAIMPTVVILLIMNCGSLLSVGYEKVFLMQSDINLVNSEVISTYIYKMGLKKANNFSYATAVGLINSLVNCIILVVVNAASRRISKDEVSLF